MLPNSNQQVINQYQLSIAAVTNHHKFSGLKQHNFMNSQLYYFRRLSHFGSSAQGLTIWGKTFVSKLTQADCKIQILAVAGLRSPFPWRLSASEGHLYSSSHCSFIFKRQQCLESFSCFLISLTSSLLHLISCTSWKNFSAFKDAYDQVGPT